MTRRPSSLYALYLAHTVSLTGNMITIIALPLYVLGRTGSASATGFAGVVATLPIVLGDLFGGTIVDRFGYRRASVLTDLAGGSLIVLVPTCMSPPASRCGRSSRSSSPLPCSMPRARPRAAQCCRKWPNRRGFR